MITLPPEFINAVTAHFVYDSLRQFFRGTKTRRLLKTILSDGEIALLVPSIAQREFYIPIVATSSSIPQNIPLMPFSEAIAISMMFTALGSVFSRKRVKLESASGSQLTGHIIAIGGPSVNEATHALLNNQKLSCHLCIHYPEHYVTDGFRQKEYRAEMVGDQIINDYGFVLIGRNPYHPTYMAIVLMGVWAHGTNSAVQAFLGLPGIEKKTKDRKERYYDSIRSDIEKVRKGDAHCVTIISHSRVLGLLTGEPTIVDCRVE